MLCTSCAGTSYNAVPSDDIPARPAFDQPDHVCPDCGETLWALCRDCMGAGGRLVRDGSCSSCGQTILHWERCTGCAGSGRVYVLDSRKQAAPHPSHHHLSDH